MWEPDRKLYAFLLFVWALLLVASLATVSPEEMFLMKPSELLNILTISDNLKENYKVQSEKLAILRETSARLEGELETLSDEMESLRIEFDEQKPRLTELGNMLASSEKQATVLEQKLKVSETRATSFEQSMKQLVSDLSRYKTERNIWRGTAVVTGILAIIGWTMIFWYP